MMLFLTKLHMIFCSFLTMLPVIDGKNIATQRTLPPLCPVYMFHWGSCRKLPVCMAITWACHTGSFSLWKPESDLSDSGWWSPSSTEEKAQFQFSDETSLATLRKFYRVTTGDQSASLTTTEEELDKRLWSTGNGRPRLDGRYAWIQQST